MMLMTPEVSGEAGASSSAVTCRLVAALDSCTDPPVAKETASSNRVKQTGAPDVSSACAAASTQLCPAADAAAGEALLALAIGAATSMPPAASARTAPTVEHRRIEKENIAASAD